MTHNYANYFSKIKYWMVVLNFIIVLFYASVILLGTRYMINNHLSRTFLDQMNYLPRHPEVVFFGSLGLFAILTWIIYNRKNIIEDHIKSHAIYSGIEILVSFMMIHLLSMAYNGILLLVFGDIINHMRRNKYAKGILGTLIIVYLLANYDVFSIAFSMSDITQYFEVFEASIKGSLMIGKNILETMNIVMFIFLMITYIASQIQENENISKELDMIYQVNRELKNYAAVTEKIGESNERKRLAREIHDTLGHALTGIAAGVDACIAMIDINPQMTKQQLQIVSKVVRQGIGDVRNSLNKLRPGALEEKGLKGAIEKMIEEFTDVSDMTIDFRYELNHVDFENTKEDILFRIIQESITNALRHGGANHVDVALYVEAEMLVVRIKDNGVGCEKIQYGYGLKQMKERIAIINGEVTFDGHDGFLTMVRIPMRKGEFYD